MLLVELQREGRRQPIRVEVVECRSTLPGDLAEANGRTGSGLLHRQHQEDGQQQEASQCPRHADLVGEREDVRVPCVPLSATSRSRAASAAVTTRSDRLGA